MSTVRPRRRWTVVGGLVLIVGIGVAILTAAMSNGALTYYKTPSEMLSTPPSSASSVRLGGLVMAGSVHRDGAHVRFVLTDGAHDVHVVSTTTPPSTFRGGQGAVVQGHLLPGGAFDAVQVEVRHSNQYRPPARSKFCGRGVRC